MNVHICWGMESIVLPTRVWWKLCYLENKSLTRRVLQKQLSSNLLKSIWESKLNIWMSDFKLQCRMLRIDGGGENQLISLSLNSTTVNSRLSMHPFKYVSWLSAQFYWLKLGFKLYCLNMSCKVICHECMKFFRLTFNFISLMFR